MRSRASVSPAALAFLLLPSAAGNPVHARELYIQVKDYRHAAELFEQAGVDRRAAELYEALSQRELEESREVSGAESALKSGRMAR